MDDIRIVNVGHEGDVDGDGDMIRRVLLIRESTPRHHPVDCQRFEANFDGQFLVIHEDMIDPAGITFNLRRGMRQEGLPSKRWRRDTRKLPIHLLSTCSICIHQVHVMRQVKPRTV